ncbi:hypothetical protein [Streptosporangium minutum]|uniref:hypothetical protein n=1 Tax=Streptosporangium minutum TaxID=569862 RepID=UPI001A99119A|nr:hypothetical protein [Streptosporangium minutum]
MTTANAATSGRAAGRLAHVDALCGFALLGILIGYLASTYHGTGMEDPGFASPLDNAVRWFVALFFEAKFFLLFSFLFGCSFTLQLSSAERHGPASPPASCDAWPACSSSPPPRTSCSRSPSTRRAAPE